MENMNQLARVHPEMSVKERKAGVENNQQIVKMSVL